MSAWTVNEEVLQPQLRAVWYDSAMNNFRRYLRPVLPVCAVIAGSLLAATPVFAYSPYVSYEMQYGYAMPSYQPVFSQQYQQPYIPQYVMRTPYVMPPTMYPPVYSVPQYRQPVLQRNFYQPQYVPQPNFRYLPFMNMGYSSFY